MPSSENVLKTSTEGWLLLVSNGCMMSFLFPAAAHVLGQKAVGTLIWWDILGNAPVCQFVLFLIAAAYAPGSGGGAKSIVQGASGSEAKPLLQDSYGTAEAALAAASVHSSSARSSYLMGPRGATASSGARAPGKGGSRTSKNFHSPHDVGRRKERYSDPEQESVVSTAASSTISYAGIPLEDLLAALMNARDEKKSAGGGPGPAVMNTARRVQGHSRNSFAPDDERNERNRSLCSRIFDPALLESRNAQVVDGYYSSLGAEAQSSRPFGVPSKRLWTDKGRLEADVMHGLLAAPFQFALYFFSGAKADLFGTFALLRKRHVRRLLLTAILIRTTVVVSIVAFLASAYAPKIRTLAILAVISPPSSYGILLTDLFQFPAIFGPLTVAFWSLEMVVCVCLQSLALHLLCHVREECTDVSSI
eukprot:g14813.t1